MKFAITDTKHYVTIITLSTQDNTKLLQQLRSGFKRAFNWNKYQSKVSTERQNQCLDFLIDTSFQEVDFLFYCLKMRAIEKHSQDILPSKSRNKRCFDWWKKQLVKHSQLKKIWEHIIFKKLCWVKEMIT